MEQKAIEAGKTLLRAEAEALAELSLHLDASFGRAASLIFAHKGKVAVSGVGKSGLIARKIAATLCSTGTPAIFLHAADAVHGDLGILHPGDPVILISKSGTTAEVMRLLPTLRQMGCPIIAIVGNRESPLAGAADAVLDIVIKSEADPLGLVPTTSTLLTLAMGDALASALMVLREFKPADFAKFHPAGQLGRNLLMTVREAMKPLEKTAVVTPATSLRDTVIAMTTHPHGAACVCDESGRLEGVLTDGDLRRALRKHDNFTGLTAGELMTRNPVRAEPDMGLGDAARLMEDRPSQISVLPVVDPETGKCIGLIRIHDIYQAGLV
jgi:arabinose-5-phosphate isomerase